MRPLTFSLMLCAAVILVGCAQPDGSSSGHMAEDNFAYDERDAIPNDIPLPKPGVNQRPIVGVKKVLVSVVNWQGENTLNKPLVEKHTLSTDPDSLRSYVLAASNGKLTLDGQVISYTSGPRPDLCKSGAPFPYALAQSEGEKAAKAQGLDPAKFDYLINVIDCGRGAIADMPGRIMGVFYSTLNPFVYKHEFGHNLGYNHGKSYTKCPKSGDTVLAPAECTTIENGDTGDTVSGGRTLYPANNRWYSGWLDSSQAAIIESTGLYRLGVLGREGPQLYLINRHSSSPSQLALEYRKPTPFDNFPPTDNRVTGVWIRYTTMERWIDNVQLDGTPETVSTADPTLQPGRTLVDDSARIKVCSADATGASVAVSINAEALPDCDTPYISSPAQSSVVGILPVFSGSSSLSDTAVTVITAGNPGDVLATTKTDARGQWSVRSGKELKRGTRYVQAGQSLQGQPIKWSKASSFHVIER
ncbi:putative lipoprotein [Pseudomonas fluorescens]|uniref:Putative lipoprotein n=1 Tax=Pseudomonas fluorescens TaxID=294 RepID=A0A0P9B6H2_PSEFL|nr:transposase [Pseudomonas fluorescens]KPU58309.1 putative lipoprotein [Pseudomonas fluorescens]